MRTKVVDSRELWEGVNSITHVQEAISYRVGDLTSTLAFSLSHSVTNAINLLRQLFSTKAGHRKAVPKFCLWNGDYFSTFESILLSDVFAL